MSIHTYRGMGLTQGITLSWWGKAVQGRPFRWVWWLGLGNEDIQGAWTRSEHKIPSLEDQDVSERGKARKRSRCGCIEFLYLIDLVLKWLTHGKV